MKWMSRLFLILTVSLLAYLGYFQWSSSSEMSSKEAARRMTQPVGRTLPETKPVDLELPDTLQRRAREQGFQFRTVETRIDTIPLVQHSDNTSRTLSQYGGQWRLVNFWASWCMPCREEMPSLERLSNRPSDRGPVVLTVNAMESRATVREFVNGLSLTLPVYRDPDGRLMEALRVRGLPVTWLVGPDDRPVMVYEGSRDWNARASRHVLRSVVKNLSE